MKCKRRYIQWSLTAVVVCSIYGYLQFQSVQKILTFSTRTPRNGVAEFRRRRVRGPWNVSTPVLILSLPKSGTTSLARYFICGGIPTAHTHHFWNGTWLRLGDCFRENVVERHKAMLDGCGPYKVWADLVSANHTTERIFHQ